ncbi:MAG: hypothetical protein KA714_01610 [Limnoraphis sp. WC205]|jgi:hypothetical protein|nr:hypothetical protein [Limnoraphis sp. WC205]
MSEREQVQIDGFRVSGPVQGKRIEIEFDVKPTRGKGESSYRNSSDEWDSIWYLFFLLFGLVFFVGNTAGTNSTPFQDALSPTSPSMNSLSQPNW